MFRKVLRLVVLLWVCVMLGIGIAGGQDDPMHGAVVLTFDDIEDSTNIRDSYSHLGLTFSNAVVLNTTGTLNYRAFPPHSGIGEIVNQGTVEVVFDDSKTGVINKVGAFVTGKYKVKMTAYDKFGVIIGMQETTGINFVGSHGGGPPNQLLLIESSSTVSKVVFSTTTSSPSFTIDDFFFDTEGIGCYLNTPLYTQIDDRWKDDPYGNETWSIRDAGRTMEYYGCATSTAAMVLSYYGALQNGSFVTPGELNEWLRSTNLGYIKGYINWFKVAKYARENMGISLYYRGRASWNKDDVQNLVCDNVPVIIDVDNHFVVTHGENLKRNSLFIRDPLDDGYNLEDTYGGRTRGIRKFSTIRGRSLQQTRYIMIVSEDDAPFVVTDPSGFVHMSINGVVEILNPRLGVYIVLTQRGEDVPQLFIVGGSIGLGGEFLVEVDRVNEEIVLDESVDITVKVELLMSHSFMPLVVR